MKEHLKLIQATAFRHDIPLNVRKLRHKIRSRHRASKRISEPMREPMLMST